MGNRGCLCGLQVGSTDILEYTTNNPRMMGYLGAEAAVMYGTVPDDFLLDNVQCGGGEESLLHCR